MPASLETALVFAVLIVPGLLLISGYNRTRAHTLPRRDLYVLAQAIAVSLAWLPAVWLLGGRSIVDWANDGTLRGHDGSIIRITLLNLVVPLAVGLLAGRLVDWIGEEPGKWYAKLFAWTGIFEPPTAWEKAWLLARTGEWAAVEVNLKDGRRFHVLFDDGSRVGLSPGPRHLFFDTEYHWEDDEPKIAEHDGIFIDATDVESIRIEHIEPPSREQAGDD